MREAAASSALRRCKVGERRPQRVCRQTQLLDRISGQPVEAVGVIKKRLVAAFPHRGEDLRYRRFNAFVLCGLKGQQAAQLLTEIGIT